MSCIRCQELETDSFKSESKANKMLNLQKSFNSCQIGIPTKLGQCILKSRLIHSGMLRRKPTSIQREELDRANMALKTTGSIGILTQKSLPRPY